MGGAALPAFDVEGGVLLALMRGLSVAALLSVTGTLVFHTVLAPPVLARMERERVAAFGRRWRMVLWCSWWAALAATLGWLVLQAASMAGAASPGAAVAATRTVLTDTRFGHLVLLRVPALVAAALALGLGRRGLWAATALACLATALQAGHGHAASMYDGPSLLLLSEIVHLLAAGSWLGGLVPLLLLVAAAPADVAGHACRRFSALGTGCVLLLAATASYQSWVLIGGVPALIGTSYGLMAAVKLMLFAILIGIASRNRFRLTPALATDGAGDAKARLCRSIVAEAGLGVLAVLAAGLLTSLPPAMHTQPLWPFANRLSLEAVREDAGFRLEVVQAGLAVGGSLALAILAILVRRIRWPAIAGGAVICWFAVPHFDLLLGQAYPTSFYRSTTGFAAAAIVEGGRLFPEHCAACHGAEGRGDGTAGRGLPIPPADLTAAHLWMHSDGELFWWLSHGIDGPDGRQVMPGFAALLSDDERWSLIDYVRAHNAGLTMRSTGGWSPPMQAPELQATCNAQAVTLHDLRGRFVRLVIGSGAGKAGAGAITLLMTPDSAAAAGGCVVDDESAPLAYATVSGIPVQHLSGLQVLIDDQGWLRALQRPGQPDGWDDPKALTAEIDMLRAHPVDAEAGAADHMNMRM